MIQNYFKLAFRNIQKNVTYSFINIFGLAIGLISFLLIALYIFDELTADSFHKNSENIYRIVEQKISSEGKESKLSSVAYNISARGKKELAEALEATRLTSFGRANISNSENTNVFYETFYLADASFLKVFDFELLEGDPKTALEAPNTVIITEETAQKIFGKKTVVGKFLQADRDSVPFLVTAVLKTIPANSHLQFNMLFSEATLKDKQTIASLNSDWTSNSFTTYFLLKEDINVDNVNNKINNLVAHHNNLHDAAKSKIFLQPLKDVYFKSKDIEGDFRRGNISYVYIFSILDIFVLLIACSNYINLTTARFANRAKEIAIRKVAGAYKHNLISQFLSEAILVTLFAFIVAFLCVKLLLPYFNTFVGKQLTLGISSDYRIWIGLFTVIIIVSVLSGLYPAFFQSKFKPISLLKSKVIPGQNSLSVRKGLVIFQFTLSIAMIVSTIIVYQQLQFINKSDLGFNKEQLLVIDINSRAVRKGAEAIKQQYMKVAAVKDVTTSSRVPGEWKVLPKVKVIASTAANTGNDMYFIGADDHFISTYQINLVKGRNFTSSPADSTSVILNETAALQLGIKEPSEQLIEIPAMEFSGSTNKLAVPFRARVIGITKDFNFKSLHEKIEPMVIGYQNNPLHNIDYFSVRVNSADMAQTIKQLEAILLNTDQSHLFEYNFLDKQWDLFYYEDQRRQTIFIAVALITILIACLGLFGLATYAAEQRTKEIGIRKVLGASVAGIVGMLSKDFLKLVIISTVIAVPVSLLAMQNWLKDFAYRIEISWTVFALAGLIAVAIAFITTSYQAIKAALSNPVKNLRIE